jgi:hypothetical protein
MWEHCGSISTVSRQERHCRTERHKMLKALAEWWLGNSDSNLDKEIPPCQRRIMAAQACLKSAIKLFGKDWHSSANRAVLWPVSGSDGLWDPAPPAPSPRRGFGGAAQRRPEPNGGSQCQRLPRSDHLRHRQRALLLQGPRAPAMLMLRNPVLAPSSLALSRCCNHQAGRRLRQ